MNNKKRFQEFSDKMFKETGVMFDVDLSVRNIELAYMCEAQRQASGMPEIPVLSMVELADKSLLDGKLAAFKSDYFVVLKEHAGTYQELQEMSKWTFHAMKKGALENIDHDWWQTDYDLINRWAKCADEGDMIYFRRRIPEDVEAKAYRDNGADALELEATDEYVFGYEAIDEGGERHVKLKGFFPL